MHWGCGLAMGLLCSVLNRLADMVRTTADNMSWEQVQPNEVDAIAQYIIARLGAGTAKERRKLEKLKAQKKPTHKKTKQRLDEK